MSRLCCFLTGASGLLGRAVVARLLQRPDIGRIYVLARPTPVRSPYGVIPVMGDVTSPGLGIAPDTRARLKNEVDVVLHLAAATAFSQSLTDARAINTEGTRRVLDLTSDWSEVSRWIYVSTAFVAGKRIGRVAEDDLAHPPGWVNNYEQSKAEGEALVRAARGDWAISRPATIVCDDNTGRISQTNAVHRALRLYFGGLAAMLPGTDSSALDVIPTDYAARGIEAMVTSPAVLRRTFHFCAGDGAIPLDELLEVSYEAFLRAPMWKRKGIARPVRTDLETYRLFESAIEEAGSERVRQAVRSLGHFVPQLAYPKRFDTSSADALLGYAAPPVSTFWTNMVNTLVGNESLQEAA